MSHEFLKDLTFNTYDKKAEDEAKRRLDHIAKPLDGLGSFETMLCRIAGIQGSADIDISRRIVVMMCADNGIVDEGISQSSYDVTSKVAASMSEGRSSVCLMAESAGADTLPVNIGIKEEGSLEEYENITPGANGHFKLLSRSIAKGTRNFAKEPAMTAEDFDRAVKAGIRLVKDLSDMGYRIICTGEMGIGNTTTSAALAAAILRLPVEEVTGRGAGLDNEGYKRKVSVIDSAIKKYDLYEADPVDAACIAGGFDIAALTGIFTGGAMYGIPVVIDGVISGTAALLAYKLCPVTRKYMLPSHLGDEKAMKHIMRELGFEPVIHAGMKLGEGTGAVMLLPMLDTALALYTAGSSFDDIKVGQYVRTKD